MPRNNSIARNSSLRTLKRINNKSRLKIIQGELESAETLLLEEGKLSWGVDTEDANEQHLQEVLVASQRSQSTPIRTLKNEKAAELPAAYIPTPDSTGVVDNYQELYPPNRWKDSEYYVRSSETVEECLKTALANGFTYYMDERDKDWLDKNNGEARGEGTSALGALSSAGTTTRSGPSSRTAKSKGKEPEVPQAVLISEDEFELVMGLLEKVTHEKTEFLHHSFDPANFPPFSDYQETFSCPLSGPTFSTFAVPEWIPPTAQLLRIARVVYPHWKERRIERNGHKIIPGLNFDESDTLNESYICFRRRDVKAVRKTRASQMSSSDRLIRLNAELSMVLDMAQATLNRETYKKECSQVSETVWTSRQSYVDLKRKLGIPADKADEDLLFEKERVLKKPKIEIKNNLKRMQHDSGSPATHAENVIKPRDRLLILQSRMEKELQRQKERDHGWEDQVDSGYQGRPVSYASRLFKYIPRNSSTSSSSDDESLPQRSPRAVRIRVGRGGCIRVDRRSAHQQRSSKISSSITTVDEDELRRQERWRFDRDDSPSAPPEGSDEQDRELVDDYGSRYMLHHMTLLPESDQLRLVTNPAIPIIGADGRQHVVPFKMGTQQRIQQHAIRAPAAGQSGLPPNSVQHGSAAASQLNGTPVSSVTQVKKLPPPSNLAQMRISSQGSMRPPSVPTVSVSMPQPQPNGHVQSQPPGPRAVQSSTPNGVPCQAANAVQTETAKQEANGHALATVAFLQAQAQLQATQQPNHDVQTAAEIVRQSSSPSPHKQNNQAQALAAHNYHLGMNGFSGIQNSSQWPAHQAQLTPQQMQAIKTSFANISDLGAFQMNGNRPIQNTYVANGTPFNVQLNNAPNINLKLPPGRQAQWNAQPIQRPSSVNGGLENGVPHPMSPPHHLSQSPPGIPARTPSANGSRNGVRGTPVNHGIAAHGMSQLSSSPIPSQMIGHTSPRPPATPLLKIASPSLQHQQAVGGSNAGF